MTDAQPAADGPAVNRLFDEIAIGDTASLTRTIAAEMVELYDAVTGVAWEEDASHSAHAMLAGALIAELLGNRLPGAGTAWLGQELRFGAPIRAGDSVTLRVTVKDKRPANRLVLLDCEAARQDGAVVLTGTATVSAPAERATSPGIAAAPALILKRAPHYEALIRQVSHRPDPPRCAVAHPCERTALEGPLDAAREGIVIPVLVGPEARIRAVAKSAGLDLEGIEIRDAPHSHAAAEQAVAMVRAGEAALLMKGSLHTDELLHAVLDKEAGLRTDRRLSHVFIMDVPTYPEPLFITDAAINIAPDLRTKADIIQNAIDLHRGLGLGRPRVAILSAVETVNPAIPGTLDAAALCKMADRGQITGGVLDGPLAMDNAISVEAARVKGIESPVAGRAQVLVVPDLESGNMLAKNLSFMAGAEAAGIVLGARVPIVLTSRADSVRARLASCAVAALYAKALAWKGGGAQGGAAPAGTVPAGAAQGGKAKGGAA